MKNTGFSSYVDDNTPYTTSEKIDDVVSTLEETVKVMFRWFTENQMKPTADKCHLFLNCSDSESKLMVRLLKVAIVKNYRI